MSKFAKAAESLVCPCGSGQSLVRCCGRFHAGAAAPSAEALMRSRYSAFVLLDAAYLLATWHGSTRPASVTFEPGTRWLGLTVVSAHESGDQGEVEFIARFRIGGASAQRLHEHSRFVREAGRWFYVNGEFPAIA